MQQATSAGSDCEMNGFSARGVTVLDFGIPMITQNLGVLEVIAPKVSS